MAITRRGEGAPSPSPSTENKEPKEDINEIIASLFADLKNIEFSALSSDLKKEKNRLNRERKNVARRKKGKKEAQKLLIENIRNFLTKTQRTEDASSALQDIFAEEENPAVETEMTPKEEDESMLSGIYSAIDEMKFPEARSILAELNTPEGAEALFEFFDYVEQNEIDKLNTFLKKLIEIKKIHPEWSTTDICNDTNFWTELELADAFINNFQNTQAETPIIPIPTPEVKSKEEIALEVFYNTADKIRERIQEKNSEQNVFFTPQMHSLETIEDIEKKVDNTFTNKLKNIYTMFADINPAVTLVNNECKVNDSYINVEGENVLVINIDNNNWAKDLKKTIQGLLNQNSQTESTTSLFPSEEAPRQVSAPHDKTPPTIHRKPDLVPISDDLLEPIETRNVIVDPEQIDPSDIEVSHTPTTTKNTAEEKQISPKEQLTPTIDIPKPNIDKYSPTTSVGLPQVEASTPPEPIETRSPREQALSSVPENKKYAYAQYLGSLTRRYSNFPIDRYPEVLLGKIQEYADMKPGKLRSLFSGKDDGSYGLKQFEKYAEKLMKQIQGYAYTLQKLGMENLNALDLGTFMFRENDKTKKANLLKWIKQAKRTRTNADINDLTKIIVNGIEEGKSIQEIQANLPLPNKKENFFSRNAKALMLSLAILPLKGDSEEPYTPPPGPEIIKINTAPDRVAPHATALPKTTNQPDASSPEVKPEPSAYPPVKRPDVGTQKKDLDEINIIPGDAQFEEEPEELIPTDVAIGRSDTETPKIDAEELNIIPGEPQFENVEEEEGPEMEDGPEMEEGSAEHIPTAENLTGLQILGEEMLHKGEGPLHAMKRLLNPENKKKVLGALQKQFPDKDPERAYKDWLQQQWRNNGIDAQLNYHGATLRPGDIFSLLCVNGICKIMPSPEADSLIGAMGTIEDSGQGSFEIAGKTYIPGPVKYTPKSGKTGSYELLGPSADGGVILKFPGSNRQFATGQLERVIPAAVQEYKGFSVETHPDGTFTIYITSKDGKPTGVSFITSLTEALAAKAPDKSRNAANKKAITFIRKAMKKKTFPKTIYSGDACLVDPTTGALTFK
jgi:hypothetical protein